MRSGLKSYVDLLEREHGAREKNREGGRSNFEGKRDHQERFNRAINKGGPSLKGESYRLPFVSISLGTYPPSRQGPGMRG